MANTQWGVRAMEPCYDVVRSLREVVENLIGKEETAKLDNCLLDRILIGINGELEDFRQVVNFRARSDQNNKISITDVNVFLANPVLKEVTSLIGDNQLNYVLLSGCWFELIGDRSLVQRIGERLDYSVSDPAFLFRPYLKPPLGGNAETPLFERQSSKVRKNKQRSEKSEPIDRKSLMYSRAILWNKQVNDSESRSQGEAALLEEMDKIFSFKSFIRLAKSEIFKDIMTDVKRNHKKCSLKSLVDKCCPMKSPVKSRDMVQLLKDVKSHESICELLRRILFFVFPKDLFGSCGNRVKMYRSLKLIVVSGYHVQLLAKNLIRNISLKSVPWLSCLPDEFQRKTFEEMALWVCNYLISSLRCYFYVTETKFDKSKLHFYRKGTWKRICELEMNCQMQANVLDSLTNASQEMRHQFSGFCSSGARFVPKTDSVRMINRLYKPPDSFGTYSRKLKGLRSLLQLLRNDQKFILNRNQFPDVIRSIKERQAKSPALNLFFIRADIKHCYPSIKHDVLLDIIESRMKSIFGNLPSSITIQSFNFLSLRSFTIKRKPEFMVADPRLVRKVPVVRSSVTIPGESFQLNTPLEKIKIYVDDAVIKFGNKMYRMKQGIRQGALLSADLCTLYMESFVNESFNSLQVDDDRLILEADDLIILTDSRERAHSYLEILLKGSDKYNLGLNLSKLRVNFLANDLQDNISNDIVFFSHCFNTFNQELTFDFASYAGKDMKYSFACNPFVSFKKMAKRLIRQLTFTPEVMDRRINSKEILLRNLFERVHLQAFRIGAFVLAVTEQRIDCNSSDLYNFIVDLIRKVSKLNHSWSEARSTELTEEEIALSCICALRRVWMTEKLKSRNSDVDLLNQMIEYLFSKSHVSLQKLRNTFDEYPKYPFDQIIL